MNNIAESSFRSFVNNFTDLDADKLLNISAHNLDQQLQKAEDVGLFEASQAPCIINDTINSRRDEYRTTILEHL